MKDILIKTERDDIVDNKNSIIDLNEYANNKKYGNTEFRKGLLELVKASYRSIDKGVLILVESLEDVNNTPENVDKLIKITTDMAIASDALYRVFNTLDSMLNDDKESD